jgi:tetratricopeptide (TPR) repeat protein
MAKTLEAAGKLEDSMKVYKQALDHYLQHRGTVDWYTNSKRLDLARVLHKLGRSTEAVKLLLELQTSMGRNDEPDDDDRKLMGDAAALKRNIDEGQNQNSINTQYPVWAGPKEGRDIGNFKLHPHQKQ